MISALSAFAERLARARSACVLHAMRGVEFVLLWLPRPPARSGVAVVRLDAIGDFILWLDAAKELRRIYPGQRITLLGNSIWADLARQLPYWDEVVPVDVARLGRYAAYRWRLMAAVRRRAFDIAIQPTISRSYRGGDSLIRATGARERIGSEGDGSRILPRHKQVSDRWYTRLVALDPDTASELERNAQFMRSLGAEGAAAAVPRLPRLGDLPPRLVIKEPYLVLFPGASWSGKRWPATAFSRVAEHFRNERGMRIVLCGSPEERALCDIVAGAAAVETINLAGSTTLAEFAELVRGAELLIGNDTAAIHFAAAVGTPAICVLGGGHYGRFLPYPPIAHDGGAPRVVNQRMPCYGCNWQCSQQHEKDGAVPCIGNVGLDDVLDSANLALEARRLRFAS